MCPDVSSADGPLPSGTFNSLPLTVMKYPLSLLAAAVLAWSSGAASASMAVPASALSNGSFELNSTGVGNSGYCYLGGTCGSGTIADWSGNAAVIGASSGPWQTPSSLAGWQAAWGSTVVGVQNASYIEQTTSFSAGTQLLSWVDANRNGYSNARYQVWLDGVSLGTFDTTVGGAWNTRNLSFSTTAGLHTLRWQGVQVSSDSTAFIDNLSVTAVPEPSTALMGLAGLGLLGGISRRRRRA